MSWQCSGSTNQEMVKKLKNANILSNERATETMLKVDRGKYCHEDNPYLDQPRKIGYNVTISAPHMHAYALSMLTNHLIDGARVLDVGSGSGYLTACMGYMVGQRGSVIGIDHIPELIKKSIENLNNDYPNFIEEGRVKFIEADGRLGYKPGAPYDVIHVGAAAETIPEELIEQLAPGGRMIIPVENYQQYQSLIQVDKNFNNGKITKKKLMQVSYVPLTDQSSQLKH